MFLMSSLGPILARDCDFDTVAPCGENLIDSAITRALTLPSLGLHIIGP